MIWLYFHINIYSITIVVTISFIPGVSLVDAAMSRLLISSDMEEELSINFQNVIKVADRLEENLRDHWHWVGM